MIKKISKKETSAILASEKNVLRNDLRISDTDTTDYYLLPDQRLLLDFKNADHSTLFDSEAQYLEFMGEITREPVYILKGFPSTREGFMQLIDESRKQLEAILHIKTLDFSFRSLKEIDIAVKKIKSSDFYFTALFPLLVPYVSQTIILEKTAKWFFERNDQENVLEPFIDLPNGKRINVFIDLYEEASENFDSFSIYETALWKLDKLNLF